ncbi:hotdog fold thioesterase [Virgibacillus xinjiangensis]|uniref:Hotdog fold thioesterase n=1 Tax=Virgibacillus xinjiangensis TaxID=393090 RepID=A0ABV7CYQ1_9BACI
MDGFKNTLMEQLGMEMISITENEVQLSMPVDHRVHQPAGFLHGGASAALAETAASMGSAYLVDLQKVNVFGTELNSSHIKSKQDGTVTAKAVPLHKGKTSMVWEVKIVDEQDQLISISRCTVRIMPKTEK